MAHQGHESNADKGKQRQQPDRDRGNLGHGGSGTNHPTGTSGRSDAADPNAARRVRRDDDDEPGLSTRTTY